MAPNMSHIVLRSLAMDSYSTVNVVPEVVVVAMMSTGVRVSARRLCV